jgi:hypothetical protein
MFGLPTSRAALRETVGDLRQLASVRRITLDDGVERGLRVLAFSTGGGLDFWVLADRALDIGPLWFRGMQLGWQSPAGFAHPGLLERRDDGGRGVERWFSGVLMTCGLEHLRHPEGGVLHGHLPLTPARVGAYGEDWSRDEPVLFCEGEVTTARVNGEAWRLHRRIEAPIGGSLLRIRDRVENLSAVSRPFGLMHHVNFGFPLVREGATLTLGDTPLATLDMREAGARLRCVPAGNGRTECRIAAPLDDRTLSATLAFDGARQPFLQLWHNLDPATRVLAFEPCTSERLQDGGSGPEPMLGPGESWATEIALAFSHDQECV